jgi:hypothetical protein
MLKYLPPTENFLRQPAAGGRPERAKTEKGFWGHICIASRRKKSPAFRPTPM